MSDYDYKQIAALALAKCAAYDPWFPKASQATVDAWAEAIEEYQLALPDVLAGVKSAYRDNGSGFKPLPRDIVQAARIARKDRADREGPSPEHEALCNSKAADEAGLQRIVARTGKTLGRGIDA
jgi:hypothetical protein